MNMFLGGAQSTVSRPVGVSGHGNGFLPEVQAKENEVGSLDAAAAVTRSSPH